MHFSSHDGKQQFMLWESVINIFNLGLLRKQFLYNDYDYVDQ